MQVAYQRRCELQKLEGGQQVAIFRQL